MTRINQGMVQNGIYIKQVEFSKAVLWKDKQISLNPRVVEHLQEINCREIWFEDEKKNERWRVGLDYFLLMSVKKKVGQEEQYYIPIKYFVVESIIKSKAVSTKKQVAVDPQMSLL